MLELKNIKKFYETASFKQMALNGVSLTFEQEEMVAILGPSGCGKTTLLNIIGGLDRYTSGDLIINGKSTKDFRDADWDSYRNNSIGFVFQSYNLINHISVIDNVEMALTLSGVNPKEKHEAARDVLKQVGLEDHIHKKPTELSGGQKQRVAIARAIVNNPDIILLDEPTGALDSKTSVQILDLVKAVAKNKLIIMVTHNPQLAAQYSNRVIELKDGMIISDSKSTQPKADQATYQPKKTAMNFFTALKLSFNNLKTKLVRSLITAFAASIGIIGVALVLSISNGFGNQVNKLQQESLSGMPITIGQYSYNLSREALQSSFNQEPVEVGDVVIPYDFDGSRIPVRENTITTAYLDYLQAMDETIYETISYSYESGMFNLLHQGLGITPVSARKINFSVLPDNNDYILSQFSLVDGVMPVDYNQVVMVMDENHRVSQDVFVELGITVAEEINYNTIIGTRFVAAKNNDYYEKVGSIYSVQTDLSTAYQNGFELEIVGIIKAQTDVAGLLLDGGIAYHPNLNTVFLTDSLVSDIVLEQKDVNYDVKTGVAFNPLIPNNTLDNAMKQLGGSLIPSEINIYAADFDQKENLKNYLDQYNVDLEEEEKIVYNDLAEEFTNIMASLIDGISIVLIAFAAISLVVSSIMIGIITYVSVLERTKEIGVLRSLGARKKDITRVFNAETFIIGLAAGMVGIILTGILNIPLDAILTKYANGMTNIAVLSPVHALLLILVSIVLTLISGLVPARIAANKDPVNALRVES